MSFEQTKRSLKTITSNFPHLAVGISAAWRYKLALKDLNPAIATIRFT
jgi:hypothetical protein